MRLAVAGLAVVAIAGCSHVPTLVPEQPTETRSLARATSGGVTLEVLANGWRDYPSSVAEQLTPLWIHVRNDGDTAFDVTYGSLQLVDEQGHLFAAVPPMEVVRMMVGSAPPAEVGPVLVASLDSDVPGPIAQFGFGYGSGPDPMWGASGYPYGNPASSGAASAILGRALREGRLLPHTQAAGFVYFQRAYSGHVLTMRMEAPSETPGLPPLVLEARFDVEP